MKNICIFIIFVTMFQTSYPAWTMDMVRHFVFKMQVLAVLYYRYSMRLWDHNSSELNSSSTMYKAVHEIKSSELLAFNVIMDQCETGWWTSAATKTVLSCRLVGHFKTTVIYLAKNIDCRMSPPHLHVIRKKLNKKNKHANKLTTVFSNYSNWRWRWVYEMACQDISF